MEGALLRTLQRLPHLILIIIVWDCQCWLPWCLMVKSPPEMQETQVWSLGAWRIPWMEEPGRLQSRGPESDTPEWLRLTVGISITVSEMRKWERESEHLNLCSFSQCAVEGQIQVNMLHGVCAHPLCWLDSVNFEGCMFYTMLWCGLLSQLSWVQTLSVLLLGLWSCAIHWLINSLGFSFLIFIS